ncbi:site-2 protease family protein [Rhodococcus pyridinivorans]|uniref:Zinc metalloprotease Rip1 n=1 Tax=Rhodococcus pyridinivorans SB3094 TaxID=1435356 RepID=V9XAH4_9NOCA|nr:MULTISPECIES: M50 family metallopeptidase [Rhodococcus]AHD19403.1 zinc metalloprotease [Rhodococcus pyridinivorans SB3094]APE08787.1 zinc metalloprotease [Rhodococcus sp. 2G]MBX4167287.1 site-2 protease family protein [Rhodococcus sp. DMU2021]MCD2115488.1 site-2 protease family protein [Rhodococcus pyridinivorans]MCD2139849.1 site-2 protease family protein [Rhodococcus pyridinivorans]
MMFVLGVVVFALGIAVSIALHEAGHMWTAQKLGMKVRRYYIGFGPRVFAFRRGETEYGLKAVPAGGFCDIAGMTALDELAPDEVERAMYKQKTWKRLVVMSGGIAMNFLLGIVLIYGLAASAGLPNTDNRAVVGTVGCAAPTQDGPPDYTPADCSGPGPAEQAGIEPGDVIVAVDGQSVETFGDLVRATQPLSGTVPFTVERGDETLTVPVTVQQVQRWVYESESLDAEPVSRTVGAIGVGGEPGIIEYTPLSAIPATFDFTGYLAVRTAEALVSLPSKVADLWTAVTGGERAVDTPVSVVGASVIGGQFAERGIWESFVLLLAQLNFFLGAFNLLPLLPLDGGHMAVAIYEKARNWLRGLRGLPVGPPVDYMKLLPLTYVAVVIGGAYMVLTLTADIVNPIKLF